jgi:hypothetical protein
MEIGPGVEGGNVFGGFALLSRRFAIAHLPPIRPSSTTAGFPDFTTADFAISELRRSRLLH